MKAGQTKQFDTFDTKEDRKEIFYLFEKLGEGLPELEANAWRGKFLELLIVLCHGGLKECQWLITPCNPTEAYNLFVAIVGVLDVPIADAAKILTDCVRKKAWLENRRVVLDMMLEQCEKPDDRRTLILGS
jgi:hypothetical protein